MNYYVISPNAWNDGNADLYLNYMKQCHVVFMGWEKDNKFGYMFSNLQIGDRVIVARGANWKKQSFFTGIVDSIPKEDTISGFGFTQYCELRSFVELDQDELPFTIDCTCGKRRNPGSIYHLHQENKADAKIISRVEKLLKPNIYSYSLREIANWSINKHVAIPALQRGFVWSPSQVEMLWDSIFRGFPVGSFVITDAQDNQSQITTNHSSETSYFLLDGQQRYNAISLAFQDVSEDSKSVLWLDLLPPAHASSSRKFWFKLTTSAHPWGYGNDDNCSVLGWRKYRDALEKFGYSKEETKLSTISLMNTWPVESGCPVRMAQIMDDFRDTIAHVMPNEQKDSFVEKIKERINKQFEGRLINNINNNDKEKIEKNIRNIFGYLEVLQNYRISANVLKNKTIENEDGLTNGIENLENLFTRLNTLGTKISPYDLRYSAIKAYWGTIKETNDKIASTIMPAAHLAVLAFRIAMTVEKMDSSFKTEYKLANIPTILQIREFGKNRECFVSKIITELYNNHGEHLIEIIKSVEKSLCVYVPENVPTNGLPPVLRTAIIQDSTDIYLLLAVMAYRRYCIDDMLGIVLWIHWFCISSKKDICDFIFAKLINNPNITKYDIMDSLIENRMVIEPVKSENFKAVLPSQNDLKSDWSLDNFRNDIQKYPWITLFNRIFWNRQIMIFAERKYFNETFDYDPALTNFNSGHNRPWDVDHIVPQAWMSLQGKQFGEWKKFCVEWLWSIGNLAAIPFSINRSKNDKAVWNAYCENAEELLFDEKIKDLDEGITFCTDKAYLFATACRDRIISFYEDLLKILPYRF